MLLLLLMMMMIPLLKLLFSLHTINMVGNSLEHASNEPFALRCHEKVCVLAALGRQRRPDPVAAPSEHDVEQRTGRRVAHERVRARHAPVKQRGQRRR